MLIQNLIKAIVGSNSDRGYVEADTGVSDSLQTDARTSQLAQNLLSTHQPVKGHTETSFSAKEMASDQDYVHSVQIGLIKVFI